MKRKTVSAVLVLLMLVPVLAGCSGPAKAAAATPTPIAAVRAGKDVTAEGKLVPQRIAGLSLVAGGVIAEVPVREGQAVAAGQVLVRLANTAQAAALAQAQSSLARAQAQLAEQKTGPRPQEVAAAQAAVDAAQAQVDRLTQGARPEDLAAGQAALAAAQADLAKVREGAEPEQLTASANELANAQAALRQAQTAYDRIQGNADAATYPQALALEQATNNFNAAKARHTQLQRGASAATVAKANAGVQQAAAELDKLKAAPRPAELAAAQAEVRRAQAQLDLLKAGARPEALQAGEATVAAAQADVQRAEAALRDTELVAPYAGTLVTLDARQGEQVAPAAPVARLADLAAWQIETTNLTELGVTRVREGAAARMTFDAVPGLELTGKVSRIRALGENRQGDMVYTVVILPDQTDPRLRWNMTSQVTIATGD